MATTICDRFPFSGWGTRILGVTTKRPSRLLTDYREIMDAVFTPIENASTWIGLCWEEGQRSLWLVSWNSSSSRDVRSRERSESGPTVS